MYYKKIMVKYFYNIIVERGFLTTTDYAKAIKEMTNLPT